VVSVRELPSRSNSAPEARGEAWAAIPRNLSDFIEEYGSAMGKLEAADALRDRAG